MPAHPRVGGENNENGDIPSVGQGSSPRGRGKPTHNQDGIHARGLIPAWAGKTVPRPARPSSPPAHPRVGGENASQIGQVIGVVGSSPRGRGKRSTWHAPSSDGAAHPRVGGENRRIRSSRCGSSGSSPRGRGKLDRPLSARWEVRLIPAWAGKTSKPPCLSSSNGAHPRVGGENLVHHGYTVCICGSSPRGRGKPENAS